MNVSKRALALAGKMAFVPIVGWAGDKDPVLITYNSGYPVIEQLELRRRGRERGKRSGRRHRRS